MTVFVGARSALYLDGTTLDYKETLMGGGFNFENPNPLWIDDLSRAVAEIIAEQVNPVVATHGGHVDLIGVDDGKAIIAFGGGCQGCGMVDVTLKQGVEVMITEGFQGSPKSWMPLTTQPAQTRSTRLVDHRDVVIVVI